MNKIELGDEVRHRITGFKGIATAFHDYISGCRQITIQPPVNKEGKVPDSNRFDEPEVEIVKKKKLPLSKNTGGPHDLARHSLRD